MFVIQCRHCQVDRACACVGAPFPGDYQGIFFSTLPWTLRLLYVFLSHGHLQEGLAWLITSILLVPSLGTAILTYVLLFSSYGGTHLLGYMAPRSPRPRSSRLQAWHPRRSKSPNVSCCELGERENLPVSPCQGRCPTRRALFAGGYPVGRLGETSERAGSKNERQVLGQTAAYDMI